SPAPCVTKPWTRTRTVVPATSLSIAANPANSSGSITANSAASPSRRIITTAPKLYTQGMTSLVTLNALDEGALERKQRDLLAALERMQRVIVAYSGGAHSAHLAWAAQRPRGDRALPITADSASIPESHKRDAEEFARAWN